jgi:hypothetical protein
MIPLVKSPLFHIRKPYRKRHPPLLTLIIKPFGNKVKRLAEISGKQYRKPLNTIKNYHREYFFNPQSKEINQWSSLREMKIFQAKEKFFHFTNTLIPFYCFVLQ